MKSASGLGVPLIGIGLYYSHGYFRQHLDDDGYQKEEYIETKVENLPMEPAVGPDGTPITIAIDTRNGRLIPKVWTMHVGRVRLFLLDCNGESSRRSRTTSRLYGGDERDRIRQELVLGVGGVKALRALGIWPGVFHLNEGHSAFAPWEVIRLRMADDGISFEDALRETAQSKFSTTHTPVPAGHDRFDAALIEEHLGPLRDQIGISADQLMQLGRVNPHNDTETFCMTVIGLKLSRRANAVSSLHGIYSPMWKAEIGQNEMKKRYRSVTSRTVSMSKAGSQMQQLYDRHFPVNWQSRLGEPEIWQNIHAVDPGELWKRTMHSRICCWPSFVEVSRQCRRRGESDETIEAARHLLNPDALTIGFGRRFATYKRANLIFSDLDRISAILNNPERPVQIIYTGKAHPKDEPGKRFIQQISNLRHDPRFRGRVAFIESYDINVCRHLIQGVDVWLNNPRRPLEASGQAVRRRSSMEDSTVAFSMVGGPKPLTVPMDLRLVMAPATPMTK